jgi:hypothetical protein
MNTLSQLRDVENVVNACQARRHFNFVCERVQSLQYLEGFNIPWTELALIAKMPYALHWRHFKVHKVTNFEFKLATMLLRITFLSTLGGEHPLLMSATFSFVSYTISGLKRGLSPISSKYNEDLHLRPYKASYGAMPIVA